MDADQRHDGCAATVIGFSSAVPADARTFRPRKFPWKYQLRVQPRNLHARHQRPVSNDASYRNTIIMIHKDSQREVRLTCIVSIIIKYTYITIRRRYETVRFH